MEDHPPRGYGSTRSAHILLDLLVSKPQSCKSARLDGSHFFGIRDVSIHPKPNPQSSPIVVVVVVTLYVCGNGFEFVIDYVLFQFNASDNATIHGQLLTQHDPIEIAG